MKKENTLIQIEFDPRHPPKGRTDWAKVRALSDAEIEAAASEDSDNPLLTEKELAGFAPVVDVKQIRKKLNFSQRKFAETFHLSKRTVQEWEQHRVQPDRIARLLLTVIDQAPMVVIKAIEQSLAAHLKERHQQTSRKDRNRKYGGAAG